jgi:hypothetical protein
MVSFACLGHWYVQLLFAVPSLGTIGFMGRDSVRKRVRGRRAVETSSPDAVDGSRETIGA